MRRSSDTVTRVVGKPAWYSSLARVRASQDGQRVAYTGWNSTTWDTLRVATIGLTGGPETPWVSAFAEGGDVTWLADGSLLYQVREGAEILTLYHVRAPGRVERLGSIPWHAWAAEVSRDLRRAAVTIQDYRADAWLSSVRAP